MRTFLGMLLLTALLTVGCKERSGGQERSTQASGVTSVRLTLDWKPEPEFGGFYAAQLDHAFAGHGLNVELKIPGEGAPTWQLVATGKTEFAITAADQVLIARESGADVVALFAVYQTSPQGIMVHRARGFGSIEDVFKNSGTLAAENNAWLRFLAARQGAGQVKLTAYAGGVSAFLAKPDYSQQCFVTSEPIQARRQGGDPQTFLIADAGFNPYATVVIARGEYVRSNPQVVRAMVRACQAGWRDYLDHPAPANEAMHKLNEAMDVPTFAEAAEIQKPLIDTEETRKNGLGSMTAQRWATLAQQLADLKVIKQVPPIAECFIDVEKPAAASTRQARP